MILSAEQIDEISKRLAQSGALDSLVSDRALAAMVIAQLQFDARRHERVLRETVGHLEAYGFTQDSPQWGGLIGRIQDALEKDGV